MDIRAEKLAKARKKLKDHQERKFGTGQKDEILVEQKTNENLNDNLNVMIGSKTDQTNIHDHQHDQEFRINGNQKELIANLHIDKNSPDVITEMLISNKANLELQMHEMSTKLANLESLYELEISNHNVCKQKNNALQNEINDFKIKYKVAIQDVSTKDEEKKQLKEALDYIHNEKNDLYEQVELTKSMLTRKELENAQLIKELSSSQKQIDMLQIQMQQLTSEPVESFEPIFTKKNKKTEDLLEKIYELEHTIMVLQREKEQMDSHYQDFARDLKEQLKKEECRNEIITNENQSLIEREQSLINQMMEIEKRLQNSMIRNDESNKIEKESQDLKLQYTATKEKLQEFIIKYRECEEKLKLLTQDKEVERYENSIYRQENVNYSKLNADIVSDKLAAQRATEQNEKLKVDIERLEKVIIKLGKDKLELTEKWTHEKQLNKGLALKLAEVEECVKNFQNQLKAKDDEMIRLLNQHRAMEKRHDNTLKEMYEMKQSLDAEDNHECSQHKSHNNDDNEKESLLATQHTDRNVKLDNIFIPKEDAMVKLQERFLNIMDEVANLSDEKHRLEHIILQLQNETDTICEYVALYQQQRSLLKRREEERTNQLKIFQDECDKLKRHLDELRDILLRIAADKEIVLYLKEETRHNDFARVKELLEELQNCSLINPKFKNLDLNIFYPCHCCSGQLIDI